MPIELSSRLKINFSRLKNALIGSKSSLICSAQEPDQSTHNSMHNYCNWNGIGHNSMIKTLNIYIKKTLPSIDLIYSQVLHSPIRELSVILRILLGRQHCALHFTRDRCVCFGNIDRSSIYYIHNGRIIILSHITVLNYKSNFLIISISLRQTAVNSF